MKKLYSLLFLLFASPVFAQTAILVTNAGSTGTTVNATAIVNSSNNAVIAGTGNTAVPTYIVVAGAGTSGQAQLATLGPASCLMDSTIASAAAGYYVINSPTTGGDCHAQSAAPSAGTWVIGFLAASSTTSGVTAQVNVGSFIYGGSGGLPSIAAHTVVGNNTGSTATASGGPLGAQDVSPGSYVAAAGSVNVLTAALSPAVTSYVAGLEIMVLPNLANTSTTPTINVNGLGAKTITKLGTSALAVGDLSTTAVADLVYDGTGFQLTNPQTSSGGALSGLTTGKIPKASSSTAITDSNLDDGVTTANQLTYGGSAGMGAKSFNSTDTVNNASVKFGTGSSGDSTCPTPVSGTSFLCTKSSGISVSINGGAYTPIADLADTQTLSGKTFVAPALGAATATSLLATSNVDGLAPITVTTGASATLGGTFNSGYTFNQEATAATAITYTLPTAAAGKQYCVGNSYNGSAATTGTLEILTSASGQFIIFTDGTLSATGGFVQSGGAAADAACVVGVDSTHWMFYVQRGTWAKH